MTAVLLLRLEGPLQSWGVRARWDVRDSSDRPTKSGVIGLIGNAMGLSRSDRRLVELGNLFRFGIRIDRSGEKMVDFHTVSGALPSADGRRKGTEAKPYTILTPRTYLQDASFLAGLEGCWELVEECAAAVSRPRRPYFLGRKCCPPSVPVFVKVERGGTLEEALIGPGREVFLENAEGEIESHDRWLGTPAREYGATRYKRIRGGRR